MPWTMSAYISASAPIRVRFRGRTSRSMSFRACSTAAALADPSFGTWLRLDGAAVEPLVGGSSLVIVICSGPSPSGRPRDLPNMQKTLAAPARVPLVFGGVVRR